MILYMLRLWSKLHPSTIDGSLYVGIAVFGAIIACINTDEAAKYLQPEILFWLRTTCSVCSASLLALKMYRSTGYAQSKVDKEQGHEATMRTKPPTI